MTATPTCASVQLLGLPTHLDRGTAALSRDMHETSLGLNDDVVAGVLGVRAGRAVACGQLTRLLQLLVTHR